MRWVAEGITRRSLVLHSFNFILLCIDCRRRVLTEFGFRRQFLHPDIRETVSKYSFSIHAGVGSVEDIHFGQKLPPAALEEDLQRRECKT